MSPALTASASLPATTFSGSQPLPVIRQWTNPIPEGWRELDETRKYYLQSDHNMLLEMHPNGTRGVQVSTKYCVLTILILNITGVSLNHDSSQRINWTKNSNTEKSTYWPEQTSHTQHVIVGNFTGHYLCMNDRSVVYQSRSFDPKHCVFEHELEKFKDRYYRRVNGTAKKWYVGINRDGSIRCGNVTRKRQSSANFLRVTVGERKEITSPPFAEPRKECCRKKACTKGQTPPKRRCYKKWCKKRRRRFFTLKLKELRRYYNRCVKDIEIRHCKKKGKKETDR